MANKCAALTDNYKCCVCNANYCQQLKELFKSNDVYIIAAKLPKIDRNLIFIKQLNFKRLDTIIFIKKECIYMLLNVSKHLINELYTSIVPICNSFSSTNHMCENTAENDMLLFPSGGKEVCVMSRHLPESESVHNVFNAIDEHVANNVNSTGEVNCKDFMKLITDNEDDISNSNIEGDNKYYEETTGCKIGCNCDKCSKTCKIESDTNQFPRNDCYSTSHLQVSVLEEKDVSLAEAKHFKQKPLVVYACPVDQYIPYKDNLPSYPTQASEDNGQNEVVLSTGYCSIIPSVQRNETGGRSLSNQCQNSTRSFMNGQNNIAVGIPGQENGHARQPQTTDTFTRINGTSDTRMRDQHANNDGNRGGNIQNRHLHTETGMCGRRFDQHPPQRPPRYPEYADINTRQMSYTTWPPNAKQDPTRLCNVGFFYTGRGDLIRCFYCGIGLKDVSYEDDPLKEHVRYSDQCPFLLELLGPAQLASYKEKLRLYDIGRSQQQQQNTLPTNAATSHNAGKDNNTPLSSASPASVQSSGRQLPTTAANLAQAQQRQTFAVSEYRHPEYVLLQVRISSFAKWPSSVMQTPRQLAEAGFYYTGMKDVVRCCACDGGLQKWDPADDPWIEHCRWFPTCPYARQHKGDKYIALVQQAAEAETNNVQEPHPTKSQAATGYTHREKDELSGALQQMKVKDEDTVQYTKEVRSVIEMGFSKSDVRTAVEILKQKGTTSPTVEAIIDVIEDANKTQSPPRHETTVAELQKENKRLKSLVICMLCNKNDINVLFLPCSHHKVCCSCVRNITHCPECGMFIEEKIKTYTP